MPRVSVIIPTYNREAFIGEAIKSVLDQSYKDFEVIVVDDGSTDRTSLEVEKFGSKVKYIHQPNSERAVARNKGVENSSGELIAFLDSDDVWAPAKLEEQIKILDNDSEIIMTYGQSLRIDQKSNKIKPAKRQLEGYSGNVFESLLMRNFVGSPTPLVRREQFTETRGFETKYIPYEDWELWLRLSLKGKFHFIEKPLAFYRVHPGQSLKSATAQRIEKVTTELLENSFKLTAVNDSVKSEALGLANLRFCYWYLVADDVNKAKEKIQEAKKLSPRLLLDPKWYGLKFLCLFPKLEWMFDLKQYH